MTFTLPDNTHRTTILGRTGSGKTTFAAWLLANAPFHRQPYVMIDYKRDALLGAIDRAEEISFKTVPTKPGLYRLIPLPHEETEMNEWLFRVWQRERVGLFFDEMYNVPNPMKRSGIRTVLTQGRSKRIPCICLSQRPSWVPKFCFSEADFFAAFHLSIPDDVATARGFIPHYGEKRLAKYHAEWYDVSDDAKFMLSPAPDHDTILDRFEERLRPRRRILSAA